MGNILDYLDWRGDLTFEQSPFNEVDNLILACFSYIELDGIREIQNGNTLYLEELSENFFAEKKNEKIKAQTTFLQNIPELLRKNGKVQQIPEMQSGWFCQ